MGSLFSIRAAPGQGRGQGPRGACRQTSSTFRARGARTESSRRNPPGVQLLRTHATNGPPGTGHPRLARGQVRDCRHAGGMPRPGRTIEKDRDPSDRFDSIWSGWRRPRRNFERVRCGGLLIHMRFPILLLLMAGSGCAALIYEIVWFQLLQLVIGSSAVSLGLLLGAYMGGLCAGSALLPRAISREYQPLRVYAVLEMGIGLLGLAVLFGLPLIGRIYVTTATQGLAGLVERGIIAALCLLPPTVLMGASLPAVARWIETTSEGVSWMGLIYSGNIAGAVFGCLLAGFYLLRVHDMAIATYVAAGVNAAVALISFLASPSGRGRRDSHAKPQEKAAAPGEVTGLLKS